MSNIIDENDPNILHESKGEYKRNVTEESRSVIKLADKIYSAIKKKEAELYEKIKNTPKKMDSPHWNHSLIKNQIKYLKQGHRSGTMDTKKLTKAVQNWVVEYAKDNTPLEAAGKGDLNTLLSTVRNTTDPDKLEEIFAKIYDLVVGIRQAKIKKDILAKHQSSINSLKYKRYSKKHPLYPVYDLQRQILKRGGEIDRDSDLLAYYEGRSLVPDYKPMKILKSLIDSNYLTLTNTKGLFDVNLIYYKKGDFGWVLYRNYSNYEKETGVLAPHLEDTDFEKMRSRLEDNELILRGGFEDLMVKLSDKYTDILRLIKNNYKPIKMQPPKKNNKNLLPAIILAAGLIIASFLYAQSNRYVVKSNQRVDKWTGKVDRLDYTQHKIQSEELKKANKIHLP